MKRFIFVARVSSFHRYFEGLLKIFIPGCHHREFCSLPPGSSLCVRTLMTSPIVTLASLRSSSQQGETLAIKRQWVSSLQRLKDIMRKFLRLYLHRKFATCLFQRTVLLLHTIAAKGGGWFHFCGRRQPNKISLPAGLQ